MDDVKGHLVLLMAPSGSGKKTLIDGLGAFADQIYFLKTITSRTRREGTEENPRYDFISREQFEEMIGGDEFVEWANYSGNFYGTSKQEILEAIHKPQIVFKEMELQGVQQVKKLLPADKLTVIYIDAGDWDELEGRILARASISEEELELRRQRYEEEAKFKDEAEIIISNRNGQAEEAQSNFRNVIAGIMESIK